MCSLLGRNHILLYGILIKFTIDCITFLCYISNPYIYLVRLLFYCLQFLLHLQHIKPINLFSKTLILLFAISTAFTIITSFCYHAEYIVHSVSCWIYIVSYLIASTGSENPFKYTVTDLPRPEGGIYGKYYSLTALKDSRIGKLCFLYCLIKHYKPLLLSWSVCWT